MTNKTLPDGWQWKKLEEVCEKITDGTHQTPTYFDEGVVFLSSKNVTSGQIDWVNVKYIDEKQHLEMHKRVAPRINDILLAKNGTTGVAAIVDRDIIFDIYVSLAFLRPLNKIQPYFLLYYINSPLAKEQFNSRLKGAGVPNLHLEEIRKVVIPLPPLEEQKRIVAKIDAAFEQLDEAISLQKNNILRTETLKKALLVEQFSELPYEKKKLGEIAEVKRGKSKHRPRNDKSLFGGKYPFIQTGDVRGAAKYITEYSETYNEKGLEQSKLWKKGTVCLTIAANIGEVTILGIDACFPDSVVGIISSKNNNEFIYYYLTTLKTQLEAKATQAAQMNLNVEKLVEFEIPLPPIAEQEKIVAYLDKSFAEIDEMLEAQKTRLAHLEGMKKAILQEAFEGKL